MVAFAVVIVVLVTIMNPILGAGIAAAFVALGAYRTFAKVRKSKFFKASKELARATALDLLQGR